MNERDEEQAVYSVFPQRSSKNRRTRPHSPPTVPEPECPESETRYGKTSNIAAILWRRAREVFNLAARGFASDSDIAHFSTALQTLPSSFHEPLTQDTAA